MIFVSLEGFSLLNFSLKSFSERFIKVLETSPTIETVNNNYVIFKEIILSSSTTTYLVYEYFLEVCQFHQFPLSP